MHGKVVVEASKDTLIYEVVLSKMAMFCGGKSRAIFYAEYLIDFGM